MEKELKAIKDNNYEKLIDLITAKIDQNLGAYLPKIQTLVYDFEDLKLQYEEERTSILKARDHQANLTAQIDSIRKEIE